MENEFNQSSLNADSLVQINEADLIRAQQFMSRAARVEAANQAELEAAEPQEQPQAEEQPTFLSETGAALAGGAAQAVESIGGFAELTGDTLKTGLNALIGRPVDSSQNPFSNDYEAGDASWLDIPDEWVPENKTGLGKFTRGLVEFGLLTAATGGVGGTVGGGLRLGARGLAAARAAGVGAKGIRTIKFVGKGAKIAGEGAFAELISDSSEDANLMNLVEDNVPWMSTWVSNALAVDDEDNPWLARIKTVAVGAGMNGAAHTITGFVKGRVAAIRAKSAGASVDEANEIGNKTMANYMDDANVRDDEAFKEMADDRYASGRGVSTKDNREEYLKKHLSADEYKAYKKQADDNSEQVLAEVEEQLAAAKEAKDTTLSRRLNKTKKQLEKQISERVDYDTIADQRGAGMGDVFDPNTNQSTEQAMEALGREPDEFVNPEKFNATEKATFSKEVDPIKQNLKESVSDLKAGGDGKSPTFWATESALAKMSRGDKNIHDYIVEVADDLAKEAFKLPENTLDYKEVQQLIIRQANELTSMIEEGGDIAARFADYFKNNAKDARVYIDNGREIVTASPAQKAALQLTINTLAKKAQGIATGAIQLGDDVSIYRQADSVFDAMKVALIEHKKMGYMWGLDGRYQQVGMIPKQVAEVTQAKLAKVTAEVDEYIEELKRLEKTGRVQELKDLLEIQALTSNVRILEHIHDFIRAKLFGGQVNGVEIRGEWRKQLQGHFYNSILSAPLTPIKAITGTNFISMLRPIQAYFGATMRGSREEAIIAAAQIDAIGRSLGESFQMFKHNWDQGFNRKALSYDMKYDVGADLAEWQKLHTYVERYGTDAEKLAYRMLDMSVKWNTNPFVKYSQNAMGAGDAFARTVIGRMEMRARAARKLIDEGKDLNDIKKLSLQYEENFRNEIFSKNAEGRYVVTDAAAKMAGDEAAMTRALQGNLAGLEKVSDIKFMKAFFPFVRTGFNALEIAFEHTPAQRLMTRRNDIMKGVNLEKYGIRPEDLGQAQALLQGREAMGTVIIGMATVAAISGNMTGDPPMDKETRDLMKNRKIPFNSFKIPGTETYFSYNNIEPFNTLFAMTANVVQNATVLGEDWTENWMKKIIFLAGSVIVDKSMLSGVEDLARLMNPETSQDLLERTGSRYIRSHLPMAGMMKSLGDVVDVVQKEAELLGQMLIKNDVLVKGILPPKYDILSKDRSGKELTYGPENPLMRIFNELSPIPITFADDDPVKQTLLETRYNLPQDLSTYREEPLNAFEMSQVQKYMSTGSLRAELEALFNSRKWKSEFEDYKNGKNFNSANDIKLTKQGWYQDIQAIFKDAKEQAVAEFLYNNPEYRQRVEDRKIKSALSRSGQYAELEKFMQQTGK